MCPCLREGKKKRERGGAKHRCGGGRAGKKRFSGCLCRPLIPCEKARQSCCSDQSGSKSRSALLPLPSSLPLSLSLTPSLPTLLWLYCSFVAPAAGGAVRLESPLSTPSLPTSLPLPFFFPPSLPRNKAVTYSILLCPLPSITHLTARQCRATAASSSSGGVGALNKHHKMKKGGRMGGWGVFSSLLIHHERYSNEPMKTCF